MSSPWEERPKDRFFLKSSVAIRTTPVNARFIPESRASTQPPTHPNIVVVAVGLAEGHWRVVSLVRLGGLGLGAEVAEWWKSSQSNNTTIANVRMIPRKHTPESYTTSYLPRIQTSRPDCSKKLHTRLPGCQ